MNRTELVGPYDEGLNGVNQPANMALVQILWASVGLLAAVLVSVQLALSWVRRQRRRTLADAPKDGDQDIWAKPVFVWVPAVKRHFLYAPLFKFRRARRLSVFGTLPSRSLGGFLLFYAASNAAYMFAVDFGNPNKYALCAEIRGRTATLAVANMLPLVLLIGHSNPLTMLLRLKYDECIMLHRWIGRLIILEGLLHGTAWAIVHVTDKGWASVGTQIRHDGFITAGFVAWASFALILVFSFYPFRSAHYETFVVVHIVLALAVVAATIVHCKLTGLDIPQTSWIVAVAALWGLERLVRAVQLARHSFTLQNRAFAVVEAVEGSADVCRITMNLPRRVDVRPGSHAYIRLASVRFWETHPFSVAWAKNHQSPQLGKSMVGSGRQKMTTSVSFIVCAQKGFTRSLFERASACGGLLTTGATFEGPYDGHTSLDSYGHVVLVAGATGITHQLGYVRRLVAGHDLRVTAARRIVLVWTIRHSDAVGWIRSWLEEILQLPGCSRLLRVKIFITRESPGQLGSPRMCSRGTEDVVSYYYQRPDVSGLLHDEVERQIGAMMVAVCGPGGLSDEVRAAARECQRSGNEIDFEENGFSW
ncbi:Ferric reductase transmembrane component 3 [Colletotrichum trifolii]|uniref:ferric-chelate reductase (NADPH) n=1 Tax=Colletotrichum trifolii TaxID=5466 RepID=A0A4R8QV23_COLTR|nr:Ferric reductase transmembrane component 3 [Colletotrichum trifolii]